MAARLSADRRSRPGGRRVSEHAECSIQRAYPGNSSTARGRFDEAIADLGRKGEGGHRMILGALNVGVECCARKPKGQFGRQTGHVEVE